MNKVQVRVVRFGASLGRAHGGRFKLFRPGGTIANWRYRQHWDCVGACSGGVG